MPVSDFEKPRLAGIATPDIGVEEDTETKDDLDKPWSIIVHNDPINLMTYVALIFMRVFGMTREKADRHMMEVHTRGRSIVWTGERERAELYVQQLHQALLLATMERQS